MPSENKIVYRDITLDECDVDLLRTFNRYQEVNRCWRFENGEWLLKDIHFIEQWESVDKENKISSIIWCIEHDGAAIGAFDEERIIGFATVDRNLFGRKNEYVQLGMLFISYGNRNIGIGKRLFEMSCLKAQDFGAKKLYISAHSSEESQAFYRRVGCVDAKDVNLMLAEKEPYDCQMEYVF